MYLLCCGLMAAQLQMMAVGCAIRLKRFSHWRQVSTVTRTMMGRKWNYEIITANILVDELACVRRGWNEQVGWLVGWLHLS